MGEGSRDAGRGAAICLSARGGRRRRGPSTLVASIAFGVQPGRYVTPVWPTPHVKGTRTGMHCAHGMAVHALRKLSLMGYQAPRPCPPSQICSLLRPVPGPRPCLTSACRPSCPPLFPGPCPAWRPTHPTLRSHRCRPTGKWSAARRRHCRPSGTAWGLRCRQRRRRAGRQRSRSAGRCAPRPSR